MFGHLHQNPSRYSNSLTTIVCGYPVKIYAWPDSLATHNTSSWVYAKVGTYFGHIKKDHLAEVKQTCFQKQYSKFFDRFELDISDFYHWGRLFDQYIQGESTAAAVYQK